MAQGGPGTQGRQAAFPDYDRFFTGYGTDGLKKPASIPDPFQVSGNEPGIVVLGQVFHQGDGFQITAVAKGYDFTDF